MERSSHLDHSRYARNGFLVGMIVFALGVFGHAIGPVLLESTPAWGMAALTALEGGGILTAFLSPIVFIGALPLIE